MKVSLSSYGFLLCFLMSLTTFSQQKLTKEEILMEYQTNRSDPSQDSLYRWDIHLPIRATLDHLISSRIDTLLVYTESLPGYASIRTDTCSLSYPIRTYFFWKKNNKDFTKVVDGKCDLVEQLNANRNVVDFFTKNYSVISKEFFMGVIYSAEKQGTAIHMSVSSTSHEPKYSILICLAGQYKYLVFGEEDLENRRSLFHDYNKALTSYKLFKLIQTEVGED